MENTIDKTKIFFQPHYLFKECNQRFQSKRLEMAVAILNQNNILYKEEKNKDDRVSMVDVFVEDKNPLITITPKTEYLSDCGVFIDTENPLAKVEIGRINNLDLLFRLTYKDIDKNIFTKDLMLGNPIFYKLLYFSETK